MAYELKVLRVSTVQASRNFVKLATLHHSVTSECILSFCVHRRFCVNVMDVYYIAYYRDCLVFTVVGMISIYPLFGSFGSRSL